MSGGVTPDAGQGRTILVFNLARIDLQRDKTQALGKDFILDNGGVVPDVNVLDSYRRHLLVANGDTFSSYMQH